MTARRYQTGRWRRRPAATLLAGLCLLLGALGALSCSGGPEDEFFCCSIRRLCEKCECEGAVRSIGKSEKEVACQSWWESQSYSAGCSLGDDAFYSEADAFATCTR